MQLLWNPGSWGSRFQSYFYTHRYRWNWTRWGRTTHSIQQWSMVSPIIRTQVVPYACFQHRKLSSTREMDTIKNCNIREMNINRRNQRIILKLFNLCHAVSNLQIEKVVDYSIFFEPSAHTTKPQKKSSHTCQHTRQHTQRGGIVLHPPKQGKWNLKLKVTRERPILHAFLVIQISIIFLTDMWSLRVRLEPYKSERIDNPPLKETNSHWAVATGIQPVFDTRLLQLAF